jgi:hypothetical protein
MKYQHGFSVEYIPVTFPQYNLRIHRVVFDTRISIC